MKSHLCISQITEDLRALIRHHVTRVKFQPQGAFVKALQKDKASGDGDGKDAPEDMALD